MESSSKERWNFFPGDDDEDVVNMRKCQAKLRQDFVFLEFFRMKNIRGEILCQCQKMLDKMWRGID